MAAAKTTTTRTRTTTRAPRATAAASAKAQTKPVTVETTAVVDLDRVRKPFYAYVGVADLAVEKLRELPSFYSQGFTNAQAQVNQARGSVKGLPESVRSQLETIPTQLQALPAKARGTYADLVKRGHKLVTSVSNNPSTKAAVKQAKTARAQAKGAATSIRRAAGAAEKAVESNATKVG
ncbi:MAG TPA: hypothetical protein VHX15_03120 [Frankiaceae bacterium]|nr:hypothetical protein [Frankiaceae bacterium]